MSTRIPQLDGGGGYEKDDDYNAPEEDEEEESESNSSSLSELSEEDDEDDDDEESGSESGSEHGSHSVGLRERKSPRIAAAAVEEESHNSRNNNNKRRTRQSKKQNDQAVTKKKQPKSGGEGKKTRKKGDSSTNNKGSGGRGRGRPRKIKVEEDLNTGTPPDTKKMETEEEDGGAFVCVNCKKQYPTKVALNNHAYWCAPKRITRSRGGGGTGPQPANRPGTSKQAKQKADEKKKEPKKRGRKPKSAVNQVQSAVNVNNLEEVIAESDNFNGNNNGELLEEPEMCSNKNENTIQTEEWGESTEESDYETKVNSDTLPVFQPETANPETIYVGENEINEEDAESEVPVSCPNCKMTYRNVASLQKHLEACMYVSSSASEDENQDNGECQDISDELEDANEHVIQDNYVQSLDPSFSDNLQLDQNAAIKVTHPGLPQVQLVAVASTEKTILPYAQFQQTISSTGSVYSPLLRPTNSLNNIVPAEITTESVLPESQQVSSVEDKQARDQEEYGVRYPQLMPNAVQMFNDASGPNLNESCLLKQALSSSMYSTIPTGSNYQYTFPTQSNGNPAITMSRTLGQPNQDGSINICAQNYPAQLTSSGISLPAFSVSHRVPESIRSETTGVVANSAIQEQYKSLNNMGPGNFQSHSTMSNCTSSSTTLTQLPIVSSTVMGSTMQHHATNNNSEMNPTDKLIHQNSENAQRFIQQNSEYLLSSKFGNIPTPQSDTIRFNVTGNGSQVSQPLISQQINKPQQAAPTVQTYQTVTIQGENGQLYRVNIPIPQSALNCNMQMNSEVTNDQSKKDLRDPYSSTQSNLVNNTIAPQQPGQGASSSSLDSFQNFGRQVYSTLNSPQIQTQHINLPLGNSHLNSAVNVSNPSISQQLRQHLSSNTNTFVEYSQHSQEFSRTPQQVPLAQFQAGNSTQGQEINSSQSSHILQQKQLASQLGIQFPQEQIIKQNGESGLQSGPQFQGFTNSSNFINTSLTMNSQTNQQNMQSLEHQQIMYQQEIARQQQILQQQQTEQVQKHYQDLQQQQSINLQTKQDVMSVSGTSGFPSQNIAISPTSSQMINTNQYSATSGLSFGQRLPTQFDPNYLMQNPSNPSLMSHVQKLQQHSQSQPMNLPQQAVFNRLISPQSLFSTQPTLPSESRPFTTQDVFVQNQSRPDYNNPSIQSMKPGPSSTLVAQPSTTGQSQVNIPVPYQIIQGPDGTTYIIVQSNVSNLGARPNSGTLDSLSQNNISDIVQSALISNQSNVSSAIQSLQSPSFQIETPCTANTILTQPCVCPKCAISRSSVAGSEKYRKVLPSPRPIEPKVAPSENQASLQSSSSDSSVPLFVKTYMKKHAGKTVKTQLASMIMEKQTTSVNGETGDSNIILNQMNEEISPNSDAGALRKNPVLTAVVRPMEHPLQKMSDQISQIESIFSGTPTLVPVRTIENPTTLPENERKDPRGTSHTAVSSSSSAVQSNSTEEPTIVDLVDDSTPVVQRTQVSTGMKRKGEPVPTSPAKSIKVTLKRKERGDSYCINDISETGASSGPMRSIKIKAKITTGELAGTSTDVVVEPKIHIVPIPDPDSDDLDSNLTIAENDAPIVGPILSGPAPGPQDAETNGAKLTHRAVVVYEVKCNNKIQYRSSNVRAIWSYVFGTVQWARLSHNLPPISYPATNISLENKRTPTTNFNVGGLIHRAVQFLIQYLPKESSATDKQQFPFPQSTVLPNDDCVVINETGCARTEGFVGRKPFDMFGWLASKHRKPLEKVTTSDEPWKNNGVPMAVRFRTMKAKTKNTLTVMWSTIHGRGLYTRRSIEKGEMIIEYAGEVIRSLVCDQREKYYETKSIGCYMFRIDEEYVIDATMKGNAARFINHSCEPNCESKSLKILGKDRIMIFALRKISSGEELTYDYKFEKEDIKIPCACGSTKCRKYLN